MSRSKLCSYCGFALLFESLSIKFVFLYLFHIFIFIYFIFLLSFTIICCHGSYSFFFFKRFCTSSQQAEYIFSTSSGFFFSQSYWRQLRTFLERIPSCLKTFYFLFCFVSSVSFYVLLYYVMNYFRRGFFVLSSQNYFNHYCFSLYVEKLFYTILQSLQLSFE